MRNNQRKNKFSTKFQSKKTENDRVRKSFDTKTNLPVGNQCLGKLTQVGQDIKVQLIPGPEVLKKCPSFSLDKENSISVAQKGSFKHKGCKKGKRTRNKIFYIGQIVLLEDNEDITHTKTIIHAYNLDEMQELFTAEYLLESFLPYGTKSTPSQFIPKKAEQQSYQMTEIDEEEQDDDEEEQDDDDCSVHTMEDDREAHEYEDDDDDIVAFDRPQLQKHAKSVPLPAAPAASINVLDEDDDDIDFDDL
jgi:hypothetical protein